MQIVVADHESAEDKKVIHKQVGVADKKVVGDGGVVLCMEKKYQQGKDAAQSVEGVESLQSKGLDNQYTKKAGNHPSLVIYP